ncbi:MAG: hypothetical protein GY841_14425 [FCB group bacterium]|nr:hypothetical protein [FCB group bacterium]
MKNNCLTWLVLFSILALSVASSAQNATAVMPLRFGTIFPGIPKTVSKYDAGAAGEFHISGIAGDEMSVDFSLPTYMSSGPHHMQMIFGETDCALDSSAAPDQSNPGYNNLDPWHNITYRLGSTGLTIWLGGTLIPNLVQNPGDYSATIVLTVIPTGS